MLDMCLEMHIVVLPGAPRPSDPKEAPKKSTSPQTRHGGISQRQMIPLEPQVSWDRWVKVVQGTSSAYLRTEVNSSKCSLEMGPYKYPVNPTMAHHLGIPTSRQIWFKYTMPGAQDRYWNLEAAIMVPSPVVSGQDIVIPWTASNVLMFWKAFCLLKERMDRLALLRAQEVGVSVDVDSPSSHERLARYYRDFLANKDRQIKLYTISLPIASRDEKGEPIFDVSSRGWYVDRRLLIVRAHPKEKDTDGFLFKVFDVGKVSSIQDPNPPGGQYLICKIVMALTDSSSQISSFPSTAPWLCASPPVS